MLRIGCLAVPTTPTTRSTLRVRRAGEVVASLCSCSSIFEFGVPEGLRSMEAHMKALASAGEGSESVLQGRRILELAVEEGRG